MIAIWLAACSASKTDAPAEPVPAEPAPVEAAPAPATAAPASTAIPERKSDADRKSKNGHLVHTVSGVAVDVRFGRPEARGRAIFGGIVPYGEVWRTGADEATTISFDKNVLVNGQALPAGVYSVFTVPGEAEWTVIFNKVAEQWGSYSYDAAQDALRVPATPAAAEPVEAFDIQGTEAGIALRWDKVSVPVSIAAAP